MTVKCHFLSLFDVYLWKKKNHFLTAIDTEKLDWTPWENITCKFLLDKHYFNPIVKINLQKRWRPDRETIRILRKIDPNIFQ